MVYGLKFVVLPVFQNYKLQALSNMRFQLIGNLKIEQP